MQRIYNKEGTDFDVGIPTTMRPRDGTERRARDGTERRARDGTGGNPRDGTKRRPRDEIILRNGSLTISGYYEITQQTQGFQIHSRPSSLWRTPGRRRPALMTG